MGSEVLTEFEAYKRKIDSAINDYIDLLGGDYDRLKNQDTFNGLITYIGFHVFHNDGTINNKADFNKCLTTVLDVSNIPLLYNIFNHYLLLCSVYNQKPYVIQFCLFIDIDYSTFDRWGNGTERPNRDRLLFCQKVHQSCEQAQVSADTVKSIFLLKAKYGYVETPQQIAITTEVKQPTSNLIDKYKDFPKLNDK